MKPTSFEAYAVSDVPETTERQLCVVLEKTGERVWLPRSQVDVVRGHVFVPTWLAKKIKAFGKGEKDGNMPQVRPELGGAQR